MLGLYLVITVVILCITYAGVEDTMRLFAYLDLQLRYAWVRFRMYLMRRKLEQQLIKDLPEYNKVIKELKKNDRS
jgi:urease accessory protein UreF